MTQILCSSKYFDYYALNLHYKMLRIIYKFVIIIQFQQNWKEILILTGLIKLVYLGFKIVYLWYYDKLKWIHQNLNVFQNIDYNGLPVLLLITNFIVICMMLGMLPCTKRMRLSSNIVLSLSPPSLMSDLTPRRCSKIGILPHQTNTTHL